MNQSDSSYVSSNRTLDNMFQHSPLPGPDYIRVITILPANSLDVPLECEIELVYLDQYTKYEALSYSWGMNADGDATLNRALYINGGLLLITQNLFEGLLRIREDAWPQSRRLWVDAVCINQLDNDERSIQVSKMGEIYENATRTVVWLGEGESSREDSNILETVKCHELPPGAHHDPGMHLWKSKNGDTHSICSLQLRELGIHRLDFDTGPPVLHSWTVQLISGIRSLFTRRYFFRRWIFQELWNSRRSATLVYWGTCSCALQELCKITVATGQLSTVTRQGHAGVDHDCLESNKLPVLELLDPIFTWHLDAKPDWELLDGFVRCQEMECSDARDRVYSLLSVGDNYGLRPDYSASTAAVCSQFARALVGNGYLVEVLRSSAEQSNDPALSNHALPSWMPDVRNPISKYGRKETRLQDLIGKSNDRNILTLSLYSCGFVRSVKDDDRVNNRFIIAMKVSCLIHRPFGQTVWTNAREHVDMIKNWETFDITVKTSRRHRTNIQRGDLCCSLTSDVTEPYNLILILRASPSRQDEFRLVDALTRNSI